MTAGGRRAIRDDPDDVRRAAELGGREGRRSRAGLEDADARGRRRRRQPHLDRRRPDPRSTRRRSTRPLAAHEPFVLVFATPKFCKTAQCGPTLDRIKPFAARYPTVTFINVEPYKLEARRRRPRARSRRQRRAPDRPDGRRLAPDPRADRVRRRSARASSRASFELSSATPSSLPRSTRSSRPAAGSVLEAGTSQALPAGRSGSQTRMASLATWCSARWLGRELGLHSRARRASNGRVRRRSARPEREAPNVARGSRRRRSMTTPSTGRLGPSRVDGRGRRDVPASAAGCPGPPARTSRAPTTMIASQARATRSRCSLESSATRGGFTRRSRCSRVRTPAPLPRTAGTSPDPARTSAGRGSRAR